MSKFNLSIEIERWQNEEIISKEQGQKIQELYSNNKDINYKEKISYLLYIVAGICMSLGIITIIAYNWSNFDQNIRILIGLLPLVLSGILCLYACFKNSTSGFNNFVVLVNIGSVMASVALIGQIFHLNGSLYGFSIVVAILIIPMFFIFKSIISLLVFSLLTFIACIYDGANHFNAIIFIFTVIAFLLANYYSYENKEKEKFHNFIFLIIHLLISFNISSLISQENDYFSILILYVILLRLYDYILNVKNKKFLINHHKDLLKTPFYILIITLFLTGILIEYNESFSILTYVLLTLSLVLSTEKFKNRLKNNYDILYCVFCIFILLIPIDSYYLFDIIIIGTILLYSIISFKEKNYIIGSRVFNATSCYILFKFFMTDSNLMLKSILLISASIIMLIVNNKFRGKKHEK